MPTFHEKIVRNEVRYYLENNPKFSATLFEYLRKMIIGEYDQDKVDIVMQKYWSTGEYDVYDAYCFALIHSGLCAGKIAGIDVNVGQVPGGDKADELNNRPLLDLAKKFDGQFFGKFIGGYGNGDGHFGWSRPTEFGIGRHDKETDEICKENVVIDAQRAILEVGYTQASRTLLHLCTRRAVARWPYHSTWITAYVVVDDGWYNRGNTISAEVRRLLAERRQTVLPCGEINV